MIPGAGDSAAATEVYAEMHKIAAIHLSRSGRGGTPTIQPTALVHEAWLRLSGRASWKSKTHFLALASRTMRMVMIDAARARLAEKRGGPDAQRVDWTADLQLGETPQPEVPLDRVIEIDRALTQLAEKDERKANVVELRFFGGLDFEEIAEALAISVPTAKRDWEFARSWLFSRLSGTGGA